MKCNVLFRIIWDSSSWSSTSWLQPFPTISVSTRAKWITLASDPSSDRIVAGVQSTTTDGWVMVWNGSTWETPTLLTESSLILDASTAPNVAVAFEGTSGEALATYGRANQNVFFYRNWTVGGGWSSEQIATNVGNNTNSMRLYNNTTSDSVMLVLQDDGSDLNYIPWNGSSWGTNNVLETSSGEDKNQPFRLIFLNGISIDCQRKNQQFRAMHHLRADIPTLDMPGVVPILQNAVSAC